MCLYMRELDVSFNVVVAKVGSVKMLTLQTFLVIRLCHDVFSKGRSLYNNIIIPK